MSQPSLQDQHVLILGLGASGLAMARWCARQGARVTVADTREQPPQLATLQAEWPEVRFVGGPFSAALVEGTDVRAVFRSPGLSPASVAVVCEPARAVGLWVGGELSLFNHALLQLREAPVNEASGLASEASSDTPSDASPEPVAPAEAPKAYTPAVLAITGTNGKTTVTSLTGQLVERAGKTVAVAGNIGPTLLDTLQQHLDAGTLP